jgi:hypothetical protein
MTTILQHNCETNEIDEVTMTDKQIAEIEKSNVAHDASKTKAANAKQAVLDKLGLTAEELAAVL